MGESVAGTSPSWAAQTLGQRVVTAAWRAVAAHLAEGDAEPPRVATGGAGDLDPLTADDAGRDAVPPAIRDRLR
jgi:hypothetical protein